MTTQAPMYTSVMVPLDGSDFGRHAIPWAVAIARATGAGVHLVHVRVTRYGMGAVNDALTAPEVDAAQRAATVGAFDDLAHRLALATESAFSARVVDGDTAGALLRASQDVNADLIVMTTHAREGLSRVVLGSVADAVVRGARRPVLLVRPSKHAPEEREPPAVSEVLVLLDGTPEGEAIVRHAIAFCEVFGAACTLFHVVVPATLMTGVTPSDTLVDQSAMRDQERTAEAYLSGLATQHRHASFPLTSAVVHHGDVAAAVREYCAVHPVGLFAMTTRGRHGVRRAILGSVTDTLLRETTLPVLVLVSQ